MAVSGLMTVPYCLSGRSAATLLCERLPGQTVNPTVKMMCTERSAMYDNGLPVSFTIEWE